MGRKKSVKQVDLTQEEVGKILQNGNEVTWMENGKMAIAIKVPYKVTSPLSYLRDKDVSDYTTTTNTIYRQMDLCSKLYQYEGTLGSAVDILTEFAITKLKTEDTGDKKLDKILAYFNKNVNKDCTNTLPGIYVLMQQVALQWFVSGNIFPYVYWDNVEIDEIGLVDIPTRIVLLNPQHIEIPKESLIFGNEEIRLKLSDNLTKVLKSDGRTNRDSMLMKRTIPVSILRSIKYGKKSYENIVLNNKFVTHLKRKGTDFEAWGIPYLTRTFPAMATIKRLRRLDEATTEGLINLITVFKIGTDEHPADSARLRAFASLLRDPKATSTLIWAHDIDVLQVGPQGKILSFRDKYKDGYSELLRSLGIPPILLDQTGQNDPWVAILSVLEKLSSFRDYLTIWLERIYEQIANENGAEGIEPKTRWERIHLMDETAVKNVILNFYDRGLISVRTALEEAGYNYDTQLNRKKIETKIAEYFKPPRLPFSGKASPQDQEGRPKKGDIKEGENQKIPEEDTVNLQDKKQKKTLKKPVEGSIYTKASNEFLEEMFDFYTNATLNVVRDGKLDLDKFTGITIYNFEILKDFYNKAVAIQLDKEVDFGDKFSEFKETLLNEFKIYMKAKGIKVLDSKYYDDMFNILQKNKIKILSSLKKYLEEDNCPKNT